MASCLSALTALAAVLLLLLNLAQRRGAGAPTVVLRPPARTAASLGLRNAKPDVAAHASPPACELINQTSRLRCELGVSFGCDDESMWVEGCRGRFRCGGALVYCGYFSRPPKGSYGRPRYRCHCNPGRVYLYGLSAAVGPSESLRSMPLMVLQPDGPTRTLDLGPLYVRYVNRTKSNKPNAVALCDSHDDASVLANKAAVRNVAAGIGARPKAQSRDDWQELRALNPSIAPAPPGLCKRCAYVAAVRVDALHQCPGNIFTLPAWVEESAVEWFKHTAIVVLDAQLEPVGWTWLLNSPDEQMRPNGDVQPGAADVFAPPGRKSVWDARLLTAAGGVLYITYSCPGCKFRISELQITAGSIETNGRLTQLQAWVIASVAYPREPWLQGRNQALFWSGADSTLMVQPWFGLVGIFGAPQRFTQKASCTGSPKEYQQCGAFLGQLRAPRAPAGPVRLAHNNTASEVPLSGPRGARLSISANLMRISRSPSCHALLGIGHLHRREGEREFNYDSCVKGRRCHRRDGGQRQSRRRDELPPQPFRFGYYYTQFFYSIEPHAPYRLYAAPRTQVFLPRCAPTLMPTESFVRCTQALHLSRILPERRRCAFRLRERAVHHGNGPQRERSRSPARDLLRHQRLRIALRGRANRPDMADAAAHAGDG